MKKILIITLLVMASNLVQAQAKKTSSMNTWFAKKEWLQGLTLVPHESINQSEFEKQYKANKEYWEKAFNFLKDHDLQHLEAGKYPIDGENVYVSVTYGSAKEFDNSSWESHRKYIDLQYVAAGKEKIGVAPVGSAKITQPYIDEKDLINYDAEGKYYIAQPGTFFIFFPSDAHRPGIKVDEEPVKKIVVKIRMAD